MTLTALKIILLQETGILKNTFPSSGVLCAYFVFLFLLSCLIYGDLLLVAMVENL